MAHDVGGEGMVEKEKEKNEKEEKEDDSEEDALAGHAGGERVEANNRYAPFSAVFPRWENKYRRVYFYIERIIDSFFTIIK